MDEQPLQTEHSSSALHEPVIARSQVADVLVACIRCRSDEINYEAHFERLRQELGEQICGPAFCLHDVSSQEIECCFPVKQAIESEAVHCKVLPGGEALSLVHCGPCSRLGESWERLFDYIERNNLPVVGPWREVYLDDQADSAGALRIELQAPLMKNRAHGL
ncbi:MAG: GyrI-like domain-containing protein [Anaerolineales bacterium]|nr:GyrI-like domain-containing protein [Anaerolineales bacterium]